MSKAVAGKSPKGRFIKPRYRILIVDDHEDGATALGKLLEYEGFATTVVTDSSEALRHINDCKPHFILLDLAMPRVTGYELCRMIRSHPELAKVPVIALSGYADNLHVQRALEAGCDYHFAKPMDRKEFHRYVASVIEKRPAGLEEFFAEL